MVTGLQRVLCFRERTPCVVEQIGSSELPVPAWCYRFWASTWNNANGGIGRVRVDGEPANHHRFRVPQRHVESA